MSNNYYLSEQDIESLKKLAGKIHKDPGRVAHNKPQQEEKNDNEMFIAVPPCGEGIPARNGTTPGSNICCLFKLVAASPTSGVAGFNYTILPLADIKTGLPVRVNVYNIYDQVIPAYLPPNEKYIQIKKDNDGKWLVVPPGQFSSIEAVTTTTSQNILPNQCTTTCKWTWNGAYWTTDGCTTSTTTSTTTTTGSSTSTSTSTTQGNCLCPGGTTSTTTSTSTTLCSNCQYPSFCGNAVGQCYFSSCIPFSTSGLIHAASSCASVTTTTYACNCATTSTPGPCCSPPCGGPNFNGGFYCLWDWNGTNWKLSYQNCYDCSEPPPDSANTCCSYIVPCGPPPLLEGGGGGSLGSGGGNGSNPCNTIGCLEIFKNDPCFCFNHGGPLEDPAACCVVCWGIMFPLCCWCWVPATNSWQLDDACSGGCASFSSSDVGPLVCGINGAGFCSRFSGGGICLAPNWTPNTSGTSGTNTTSSPCGGVYTCPSCPSNVMAATIMFPYCCFNPGTPCNCNNQCGGIFSSTTSTTGTTVAGGGTTSSPTSTTINPIYYCGFCYNSTTSTTSPPVSGQCLWQCTGAGGSWAVKSNGCSSGSDCSAPFNSCLESCQVQITSCNTTTTTI